MRGGTAFSAQAWRRNLRLFEAIRDMRFNRELAEGSLAEEAFRHYVVQDAHYLVVFAQALAVAAVKADTPGRILHFAQAAAEAIAVERSLHANYFAQFGLDAAAVAATKPSPTCHHYASFLLATGLREPYAVQLAALLPCFWIYREVGRSIVSAAAAQNPYRAWIDTYAGEAFAEAVDRMIAATDEAASRAGADTIGSMHGAFTRAAQLEWMFWDSAYRRETWPI